MPTYATLNAGRLSTFSFELPWIVGTSCGATRSYPWTSPVCSDCRRAALFAIGRKMIRSTFAFLPQYRGNLTSSSFWPSCQLLNMYGPVPVGCCVEYVPVGWKTPLSSTSPLSASYFLSAVGLAMPKFDNASAPKNDDERC